MNCGVSFESSFNSRLIIILNVHVSVITKRKFVNGYSELFLSLGRDRVSMKDGFIIKVRSRRGYGPFSTGGVSTEKIYKIGPRNGRRD